MQPPSKHALIVAYDFPPCSAPGAAVRTEKFVRYLPEFGWRPTVLARADPACERAPEEEGVVRLAASSVPFSYQASAWLWANAAGREARRLLARRAFDLVYVTCPPFPPGLAAARVARESGLPFVADFRDSWSMDPYEPRVAAQRWLKRVLCRWVWPHTERYVLSTARHVVVTTPSMQQAYARHFPHAGRPVLLTNGYDEADFAAPDAPLRAEPVRGDRLELLYCGRFAGVGHRHPENLFRALAELQREGLHVRLRILGDDSDLVRELARRSGATRVVATEPPVQHSRAIAAMRECDALVLYQEPGATELSAIAGKTYEYLRVGKPIFAVLPPGDNVDLVERYAGCAYVCTDRSVRSLAATLRRLHGDWHDGQLPALAPAREGLREAHERRALTARLAELFDEATARSANPR